MCPMENFGKCVSRNWAKEYYNYLLSLDGGRWKLYKAKQRFCLLRRILSSLQEKHIINLAAQESKERLIIWFNRPSIGTRDAIMYCSILKDFINFIFKAELTEMNYEQKERLIREIEIWPCAFRKEFLRGERKE